MLLMSIFFLIVVLLLFIFALLCWQPAAVAPPAEQSVYRSVLHCYLGCINTMYVTFSCLNCCIFYYLSPSLFFLNPIFFCDMNPINFDGNAHDLLLTCICQIRDRWLHDTGYCIIQKQSAHVNPLSVACAPCQFKLLVYSNGGTEEASSRSQAESWKPQFQFQVDQNIIKT